MEHILVITARELKDIAFCMEYAETYNHGADGHNRMNTMAKLAGALGFYFSDQGRKIEIPNNARLEG